MKFKFEVDVCQQIDLSNELTKVSWFWLAQAQTGELVSIHVHINVDEFAQVLKLLVKNHPENEELRLIAQDIDDSQIARWS